MADEIQILTVRVFLRDVAPVVSATFRDKVKDRFCTSVLKVKIRKHWTKGKVIQMNQLDATMIY